MPDIVDLVLNIMDGPPTKGNVAKRKNGAESFWTEHQEEYEARGKPSSDRIKQVQQHNSAYPRLNNELKKKHSLISNKVSGFKIKRVPTNRKSDKQCSICRRHKSIKEINNESLKSFKKRKHSQGVAKTINKKQKIYGLYGINKECLEKKINSKAISRLNLGNDKLVCKIASEKLSEVRSSQNVVEENSGEVGEILSKHSMRSEIVLEPGSGDPSISSYNSYGSFDQEEPMDN